MKKLKLPFSPLFIILCLLLGFFIGLKQFLIYFLVVIIHELAHFLVARHLGYCIKNMYVMPYGVCLNFNSEIFYGSDEIKIALAGPLVNIFLSIFSIATWWCFPETYYYLDYFCFCNLVLGLFNLLPCFPLDGGRILLGIFSKKWDREKIFKKTIIFNYALSIILVILFFISIFKGINFTYLYIAIFLFAGCINPNKYSSINPKTIGKNYKKVQKGASIKLIAVSEDLPLYKIVSKFSYYKFNIIYVIFKSGEVRVLSENNIINLCEKYSPTISLAMVKRLGKLKN